MGNMVRGASRSCGRHTQCLFRPDSTPSLPPKAIPGRQGAPVRKGIQKGLCGRPRGSRVRREGCAKQTPGGARGAEGGGGGGRGGGGAAGPGGGGPPNPGGPPRGGGGVGGGVGVGMGHMPPAKMHLRFCSTWGFVKLTAQLVKRDSELRKTSPRQAKSLR